MVSVLNPPTPRTPPRSHSEVLVLDQEKRVEAEIAQLLLDIRRIGPTYPPGSPHVLFGELFDDEEVEQYYEALVGTLKCAKKRGIISFQGQMLFKGMHDKVIISIVGEDDGDTAGERPDGEGSQATTSPAKRSSIEPSQRATPHRKNLFIPKKQSEMPAVSSGTEDAASHSFRLDGDATPPDSTTGTSTPVSQLSPSSARLAIFQASPRKSPSLHKFHSGMSAVSSFPMEEVDGTATDTAASTLTSDSRLPPSTARWSVSSASPWKFPFVEKDRSNMVAVPGDSSGNVSDTAVDTTSGASAQLPPSASQRSAFSPARVTASPSRTFARPKRRSEDPATPSDTAAARVPPGDSDNVPSDKEIETTVHTPQRASRPPQPLSRRFTFGSSREVASSQKSPVIPKKRSEVSGTASDTEAEVSVRQKDDSIPPPPGTFSDSEAEGTTSPRARRRVVVPAAFQHSFVPTPCRSGRPPAPWRLRKARSEAAVMHSAAVSEEWMTRPEGQKEASEEVNTPPSKDETETTETTEALSDAGTDVDTSSTAPAPTTAVPVRAVTKAKSVNILSTQASSRVEHEVHRLVEDIRRVGSNPGEPSVKFGELFDDEEVQQTYEALVGTLRSAKRQGYIHFEGQMLFKGMHDSVIISVVETKEG